MVCTLSGVEVKVLVDKIVVNWVAVAEGTHAMLDCAVLSCRYGGVAKKRQKNVRGTDEVQATKLSVSEKAVKRDQGSRDSKGP